MPFDWEQSDPLSEFMNEESPEPAQTQGQLETIEDIDEVMSEAERRFEVAQYYKLLLQDNLFQNRSEAAARVEAEIRSFIKERLGVLLGVKTAPAATNGFTPEQVEVLTSYADLGEEAPEVLKLLMSKIAKKMDKRPTKQPEEPAIKLVKEPTRPILKKPEEPKMKRQASKEPREPQQTQTKSKRNVKLFETLPDRYKDDPTLKIEGNKAFVQSRTPDGELLWEKVDGKTRPLYKDVTPAAKPVGVKPIPLPTDRAAIERLTNDASSRQVEAMDQAGAGNSLILNQLK